MSGKQLQQKREAAGVLLDPLGLLLKVNDECLDAPTFTDPVDGDIEFVFRDNDDARQLAAEKAVASACVRLNYGNPASDLWIQGNKVVCEGTGRPVACFFTYMTLDTADFYWENRNRVPRVPLGEDWDESDWDLLNWTIAHELIGEAREACRGDLGWEEPDDYMANNLAAWIGKARDVLRPHHEFIQRVAGILVREGRISASKFRGWYREEMRSYRKRRAQSSAA